MKIKGVKEEEVGKFIQENYGFIITSIKYFPKGEDGASYIVKTKNKKYYCKVYQKTKEAFIPPKKVKVIMYFLFKIREYEGFTHMPLPVLNNSEEVVSFHKKFPLVVYEFIPGGNLKEFSKKDYAELGKIIGKYHRLDIKKFPDIPREDLSLKWEKEIFKIMGKLMYLKNQGKSEIYKLKKFFSKNEIYFERGMNFLFENLKYMKSKKNEYVISHSDLHKGNMMRLGKFIYIIDWDNLELALKEKDLIWFEEKSKINKYFEINYSSELCADYNLDKLALNYYIIMRMISSTAFFADKIIYENMSAEKLKETFHIMDSCISRLKKVLGNLK